MDSDGSQVIRMGKGGRRKDGQGEGREGGMNEQMNVVAKVGMKGGRNEQSKESGREGGNGLDQ